MKEFSLSGSTTRSEDLSDRQSEEFVISTLRPELNYICSNPTRACIIHLLVQNRDLNHSMQVEEIARRIGKRHSVIIYHLEQLLKWRIVEIVKSVKYGASIKRSLWGLNLAYPNLLREIYSRVLKFFYTHNELEKMCSVNKNVRK